MAEAGKSDHVRGKTGSRTSSRSKKAVEPMRCDFCGEPSPRVRRVALDVDYDRLQTPHRVQYACPTCSAEKERAREQLSRS